MIGVWNGLRALAGDALVAVGASLQKPRNEFDEWAAERYLLAMEPARESSTCGRCDGFTFTQADGNCEECGQPKDGGRMECDGPDAADVVCCGCPDLCGVPDDCPSQSADILAAECNCEIPDSEVLRTAAAIIAGWRPLLLRAAGSDYDVDELDEFVQLLRDRAARFAAVEADANKPMLSPADLAAVAFPRPRGK